MTFADRAISFNKELNYTGHPLPPGIRIMNPFKEYEQTISISETFYRKYYNDNKPRHIILGINPGRFGAGLTGIPFTDPKRLVSECKIAYEGKPAHELSSVFVYDVINAYGGPKTFYKDFYINAACPLGFTSVAANGKEKNYNYYDSGDLLLAVKNFMIESIRKVIAIGINTDICFCFGMDKNFRFLSTLNQKHRFFGEIVPLEHPRFIMQYKLTQKNFYIDKYLSAFKLLDD